MESFGLMIAVGAVIALAVGGAVNYWLIKSHPDIWHKLNDQAEKRRDRWQESQRQKAAASSERTKAAAGFFWKILFGR